MSNGNEVVSFLKRRGSTSFLLYVEKFGQVLPAESYNLLNDVILGLTPKKVPAKALAQIQFYRERGAPMLLEYGGQTRRDFIIAYDQVVERLEKRFLESQERRIDTPSSLWNYGIPKYIFCPPVP